MLVDGDRVREGREGSRLRTIRESLEEADSKERGKMKHGSTGPGAHFLLP